jgi:hypothetical protein
MKSQKTTSLIPDFVDTKSGRQKCAAGMRLNECDGRYFLCTKGFFVQSILACNLQHRKKNFFFAIPSRYDLIDTTARSKAASTATTTTAETTAFGRVYDKP